MYTQVYTIYLLYLLCPLLTERTVLMNHMVYNPVHKLIQYYTKIVL